MPQLHNHTHDTFRLPELNRIVKAGESIKINEAQALRFANHPNFDVLPDPTDEEKAAAAAKAAAELKAKTETQGADNNGGK